MIVSQEERLRAEAASCVQDIAEKSKLFNKHAEEATPRFDPDGKNLSLRIKVLVFDGSPLPCAFHRGKEVFVQMFTYSFFLFLFSNAMITLLYL